MLLLLILNKHLLFYYSWDMLLDYYFITKKLSLRIKCTMTLKNGLVMTS